MPGHKITTRSRSWLPSWRRERLRTNLWLVPSLLTLGACVLFVVTILIDHAVSHGDFALPQWMNLGDADASRTLVIGIAAAVITVAGVVFSVTIVVLTLASQQFGPRMLRNFIRDVGTQVSLGAYVAAFVFSILALFAIGGPASSPFVPHLTIDVCLFLTLVDVVVLIYFIHHIATMIQLPQVMASIARDLRLSVQEYAREAARQPAVQRSDDLGETRDRLRREGATVNASTSGYLQYVRHEILTTIATSNECTIELLYRPGHFVTEGLPMARIWPPQAAARVESALRHSHSAGPHRTLAQDPVFAIDQLVEIAIRALSPAVNDTFTALTCIDWLTDGLSLITRTPIPDSVHRDDASVIRLIEMSPSYARVVDRATDKVRQAGQGMPAVLTRQIDGFRKVLAVCQTSEQYDVLMRQVHMIARAGADIPEPEDADDLQWRYQRVLREFPAFPALR